ncbi:MAG: hypothetical protein QW797_09760 [Thermoproteota archaeon]
MASEANIVWSLRLITVAMVIAPLAFNYFSSGSLQVFIVPGLNLPLGSIINIQHSLHITSMDYSLTGETCRLSIGLSNTGSMRIGLKKLDCEISALTLNMSGRLVLQSPFILEPAREETVSFSLMLEKGAREDLLRLLAQKPPVSLSGEVILILDSAELPLNLTVTSLPTGFLPSW